MPVNNTTRHSAVGDTLIAIVGLGLLAIGLRSWSTFAWQTDTSASRSPLPYDTHVELRGIDTALTSAAWVMLAAGSASRGVCRDLRSASAQTGVLTPPVLILRIDGGSSDAFLCSAGMGAKVIQTRRGTIASPAPVGGFVLLDSLHHVAYGSFLMRDVGSVPAVLHLFDGARRSAVPRR